MAEETKKTAAVAKTGKDKKKSDKPGFFRRIGNFFKNYKSELNKVVWYPRANVVRDTGIVVAALLVAGLLIGILDLAFAKFVLLLGGIA